MKCPECNKYGEIYVDIGIKMNSEYFMNVSKTTMRKKDMQIMYANWPKGRFVCKNCGYSEKGL